MIFIEFIQGVGNKNCAPRKNPANVLYGGNTPDKT